MATTCIHYHCFHTVVFFSVTSGMDVHSEIGDDATLAHGTLLFGFLLVKN